MNPPLQRLRGEITAVAALDEATRTDMAVLMARYFAPLDRACFARDLDDKPWAILLRDAHGRLQGFSTLDIMALMHEGRAVRVVYSGDTITDRAHWGSSALPHAFLRFLARHTGMDRDGADWYWFYVCKGFRTYRFLPVFYRRFYPHPECDTPPALQHLMHELARLRFGRSYDPARGVAMVPDDYALRPGVGDIAAGRSGDPFVAFFERRNPGWVRGEELICLAPLTAENLQARPRRWLRDEMTTGVVR
jgi:hypothetical protein